MRYRSWIDKKKGRTSSPEKENEGSSKLKSRPDSQVAQLSSLIQGSNIQTKLSISDPKDKSEREADSMADRIMSDSPVGSSPDASADRSAWSNDAAAPERTLLRQTIGEEEEDLQAKLLQRQPEEEEEDLQA